MITMKTGMRCCITVLALGAVLCGIASAQLPLEMNYQVMLTNESNEPIVDTVILECGIWTDELTGDNLWNESHVVATNSIGVASVVLGSSESLSVVDFSRELWLELKVDTVTLEPRRKLLGAPYAFFSVDAAALGGVDASGYSQAGHDHDSAYVNEGQSNSVSTVMVVPDVVSSVDGVSNDGGDIDLVAGSNITITPNDSTNEIMISASGGGGGDITAVYAENGLTGTVTSGDAHLNIGAGDGITVTADAIAVNYDMGLTIDSGALEFSAADVAGDGLTYNGSYTLERDNAYSWTVDAEDMYAAVSGNVGIGDANPYAKLEVQDDSATGECLRIYNSSYVGAGGGPPLYNDDELVLIYGGTPAAGGDVLEILVSHSASGTAQFIACDVAGSGIFDPPNNKFRVNVNGDVFADGTFGLGGSGFAEFVEVGSGSRSVSPGDVMVIDPDGRGAIARSDKARSRLVAGIYITKPGICATEREWDNHSIASMADEFNEVPLTMVGIVPCKVSAENGPISPGDLLVTSDTPGHAMRDEDPRPGTILGKALESLSAGTGTIKVLMALQ
jgi:hypothetical protein